MARKIKITAASAAEASAIYCAKRDASGLGASKFPDGTWGKCHISYNGRVWAGDKVIHNPGVGPTPAVWRDSTHPDALR